MVEALILINTASGAMDKVHEEVQNIKEVRKSTKDFIYVEFSVNKDTASYFAESLKV